MWGFIKKLLVITVVLFVALNISSWISTAGIAISNTFSNVVSALGFNKDATMETTAETTVETIVETTIE